MYLQITSNYFTYTTNISQEERESGQSEEQDKFDKNMIQISESMSSVCIFFHAAKALKKKYLFNPGTTNFLKILITNKAINYNLYYFLL